MRTYHNVRRSRNSRGTGFWSMPSASVLACILTVIALTFSGPAAAATAKAGGTLRFGTENDFAGFEVIKSSSRLAINGSIAANTIMEPLFRMDTEENLVPVLGVEAALSQDGKTWTIKLRQGVRFHDGTVFNADAVVDHWGRMFDPQNKFRARAAMSAVVGVEKLDDYTVQFRLKHPWLPFKRVITSTRSLVTLIPSPKAVAQGTQGRAPVGTGPFKFKEWKSGDRFVVEKNPAYWQNDRPYLDEIVFRPMPDHQTRYAGLKSGQLDIIWTDRGNIIHKAGKDSALTIYESEDNGAEIFVLNTAKPPLDDVDVRRALAHAHNQQRQVSMVYQDSIPLVHHPFGSAFACPDDGYREYNPDKARTLIEPSGNSHKLEVLHSNSKRGRDTGQITQQMLKDIGVAVTPVGLNFGPVVQKVISGDYQMSTWRISSRPDQGPALFLSFHSKSRANFSHYQNPQMDQLLMAQRMETDPGKRQALLCRIARLINEDVPIIYRGGMRSHVVARKAVRGITEMSNGIVRLEDVWME